MIRFFSIFLLFVSCDDIGKNYSWNENSLIGFSRKFGTDGYDYGWNIAYSPFDKGTIIVGSQQPNIGSQNDLWAIKTDERGLHKWDKKFGGNKNDEGYDVIATSDGGFLFVGYTWSFGNEQQIYIIKTDFYGNLEWEKTYGGSMWEVGNAIIESNNGGYYVLGYSNSPGISSGNTDILLLKIDMSGNQIWMKSYGNKEFPNHEWGNDFIQLQDNSIIIVGARDRYSNGSKNSLIIKVDENGTKLWEKEIINDQQTSENAYSISESSSGGIFICIGKNNIENEKKYFPEILKLDYSGNIDWKRNYNTNSRDYHQFKVEKTIDGGALIVGSSLSGLAIGYKEDIFVIRIDSNGNIIWTNAYGTADEDDRG